MCGLNQFPDLYRAFYFLKILTHKRISNISPSSRPDSEINLHCRFTNDIYEMTGYRPGLYWQITWRFIGPIIMFCILASSVIFMIINNPTYQAWDADKVTYTYIIYKYHLELLTEKCLDIYETAYDSGWKCQDKHFCNTMSNLVKRS